MTLSSLPLRQLPGFVKISVGFFALHTVLYIEAIIEALLGGVPTHPMWFFHIGVCAYLLSQFPKAGRGVFYIIAAYCLIVPTQMLRAEYVPGCTFEEALSLMFRTLILCIPLYLTAFFLIAGRRFYFAAMPNPSINTDAAR